MARKARHRISYVLPLPNSTGGHRLGVNSLAVDNDRSILYSGGRDGLICAWDVLPHRSETSEDDHQNHVSKQGTTRRAQVEAHTHWINDIALADNGSVLVSASSDLTVKAWRPSAEVQTTPETIGVHRDYVKCLATPDANATWVASGGLDHRVCLWDLQGGGQILEIDTTNEEKTAKGSVYAIGMGGGILASGGPESIVRVWDPRSGRRVTKFVGHTDNIRDILVSDYSDVIMTASSDQTVKVWSLTAGRCMHTFTMHADSVWSLHSDHPRLSVFYSSDRSGLVAKTTTLGTADVDEGRCVAICQEHGAVNKVVGTGTDVWTATLSSSINRWADIDIAANYPAQSLSRRFRPSSVGERSRTASSPKQDTFSPTSGPSEDPIPLRSVLHLSNLSFYPSFHQVNTDVNNTENTNTLSAGPQDSNDADFDVVTPLRSVPQESIDGQNGLIKHVMLNDRRRVLTQDTTGEVMMWDLVKCEPVQSYGRCDLDKVVEKVNTAESVANWCTVDTRTGRLACVLEEKHCFDGEMYADELPNSEGIEFREDQRINLGKWVLRYLFSALIDEEIRRDDAFRSTLISAQRSEAVRSPRMDAPRSIQLPSTLFPGWPSPANDTPGMTPRAVNGSYIPPTPGMAIGAATPAPQPRLAAPTDHQPLPSTDRSSPENKPSQYDLSRTSSERTGDYFSSVPEPPLARELAKINLSATTSRSQDNQSVSSSSEPDKEKETQGKEAAGSRFGMKFRMPFASKKLSRTTTADSSKPTMTVANEQAEVSEDSASTDGGGGEAVIEDNFFGVVQTIREAYIAWSKDPTGHSSMPAHITPSLPTETPVLKLPPATGIIIQEDRPDSGGIVDLYRGTVASMGEEADLIEKVAPVWLGDLLLRNHIPLKEVPKISFVLQPLDDSLPSIASPDGNVRLNANRMLRTRKILSYVAERLEPLPSGPVEGGRGEMKVEDYMELYCQNQLLHPKVTLATVRAHIWKGGGDVLLHYKAKTIDGGGPVAE
ncbi:MAG: hypothetical protein M1823_002067 [Watsoniomyces obsoletus]|nr:MAG: hypothetical protein M1823_002067 [Watsoniomyces obsoletus]